MGRTVFTTITPIPAGVSRETVMETLHNHLEMIDLNPTHDSRAPIKPPPEATPEEYHCKWYQITDKISYLPGVKGDVHFKACFHDLPQGLQTHVYAPMGLDIKEKWTLGGSLPHEPVQPVEIGLGVPITGLYLREDVEMKCNFMMTKFVKKQLKDALAALVARMVVKSQLVEAVHQNRRLTYDPSNPAMQFTPPLSPPMSPRQTYSPPMSPPPTGGLGMQMDYPPKWAEAHASAQQAAMASQRNSQYSAGQQSPQLQYAQPQQSPGLMGQPQYSAGQQSPQLQYAQPQQSPGLIGQPQYSPQGQGPPGAWQTQNYHQQLAMQKQQYPEQPQGVMEMDATQTYMGVQQGHAAELP